MNTPTKLPSKFIERISAQLGEETQAFFDALNEQTPTSVRTNNSKKTDNVADFELKKLKKVAWLDNGYYLPERPVFTTDPHFHTGAYYVQEASSMFLSQVFKNLTANLPPDAKILDLCAAPGGKSTLILDEIPETMLLVSNEIIKSRANILAENISKWGKANVVVTNNNPKDFKNLPHFFDIIVVDAPCSGEGMFRKDKKAIEEWSEENVEMCAIRQQKIIDDILPSLKPGGILVYSTCTYAELENRHNVLEFINNLHVKSIALNIVNSGDIEIKSENNAYSYHFYPHKTKGEGFFLACFQKSESEVLDANTRSFKFEFLHKKQMHMIEKWVNDPAQFEFIVWKEVITAIPMSLKSDISSIQRNLNIIKKGVEIGKIMGNEIIPSHELALSLLVNNKIISVNLTKEEALLYLKKGDVSSIDAIQNLPNGWALTQYEGNGLGWIKKIGNRTNNYLPKELRILMDI